MFSAHGLLVKSSFPAEKWTSPLPPRERLPAGPQVKIADEKDSIRATSDYLQVEFSLTRPQLLRIAVDSLGRGKLSPIELRPPPDAPRPTAVIRTGATLEYRRRTAPPPAPARWTFALDAKGITMLSRWSEDDPPEPVVLDFDPRLCHPTLLGRIDADGGVRLPAVLHLPGQGTFRITATAQKGIGSTGAQHPEGGRRPKAEKGTGPIGAQHPSGRSGQLDLSPFPALGYDARRRKGGYVKIAFPPADKERPRVEYRWQVVSIYPRLKGIEGDRRFDGFRRNWLNILQLNPGLRALANHAASDTAALCYYEYADVARHTPPLADGLSALLLVRQSLDRVLAGNPAYGMTGYRLFDKGNATNYPAASLDTYPSLLIAAGEYVGGSGDDDWLKHNYVGLERWAQKLLATDRDGNGLFEYHLSGNSGSWPDKDRTQPSNWWDTIGFGHEDAYANALAYRALRGTAELADRLGKDADAVRYRAAAKKLHDAYFKTFYNPATGVLAGWRSADGQLHDYYFLFVNGIAIHYGLVEKDRANGIMDRLMAKLKAVGYKRFDLGLPGNLIPVPRNDYVSQDPRWGGGAKADNSDGFQRYENGGATACFAYFTLAALYDLGRREEADRILFPLLDAIEKGGFRGRGHNGMSNDWKAWDGTPWGYEGFLGDNYYVLLAVLVRESKPRLR